jgi:hypothetical protein
MQNTRLRADSVQLRSGVVEQNTLRNALHQFIRQTSSSPTIQYQLEILQEV